ncbi:MAG: quinone-dependent dihydroorotate dehydrogenase [Bacteroidia bacterium]|nr:quinone-dependent dihydroorotate dehydrogenase [Bacteroidia bacterium]
MYRILAKPFLFLFNPEVAHKLVFTFLKIKCKVPFVKQFIRAVYNVKDDKLKREFLGLKFENPVGLAAGFDKNAVLYDELSNFGFGFIEIGTVTPKPQPGNPKPRIFRLPKDEALINRLGFNNEGVEKIKKKLDNRKPNFIIGGNIGKNKTTPNDQAIVDYEICFNELFDHVDYFVVNVSSPNTPNLRELQEKESLLKILLRLQEINSEKDKRKPILLKIAPDLSNEQLDEIIEVVQESKIDGIIATNTTIQREDLQTDQIRVDAIGDGGLSGKPLKDRSNEVIKYIADRTNKEIVIIGVGGIMSAEDALAKLEAGADLIQIYTGFIYEGPGLVKDICKMLISHS